MTPRRTSDVPEVLSVQVVPSGEVRMVPEPVPLSPTATYNGLEVVLEVLSFLAQEMIGVILCR